MSEVITKKSIAIFASFFLLFGCQKNLPTIFKDSLKRNGDRLTSYDFAEVCNGYYLSQAVEYQPTTNNVHPIHIFEREEVGDKFENRVFYFPDIPETWTVSGMELDVTELVACITRLPGELIDICTYEESISTNLYDVAYEIKLIVAMTGEEIDKTIINPDKQCPLVTSFIEGEENIKDYPSLDPKRLKEFLQPHIIQ